MASFASCLTFGGKMDSQDRWRVLLAATIILYASVVAGSPIWAQSNPTPIKIGAVSQQAYAGAVAQAESGLQRPIKFGNSVYALETVRTGENGSTELQFLDEARLHVGAHASVKLDQYSYDALNGNGSGLIDMFVGAYAFVSGKMKTDDQVKLVTPTVTIGLRGTALSIYIAGDGRTDVAVTEGLVSLAPCRSGSAVTVSAGHKASVDNDCVVSFPGQDRPDQDQPAQPQQSFPQDRPVKHYPHQPKPPRNRSSKTG